jgi:hypothetical protein
MRAKVASVVLVTSGLLGALAVPFGASGSLVADRGNGGHGGHDDDAECIAEDEVVVGPVCVEVEDVDVLSDILAT